MSVSLSFIDALNRIKTPFSTVSLNRTPLHNKNIGGASKSSHVVEPCVGADLVFDTISDLILGTCEAVVIGFHGIEVDMDNQHLHIDMLERLWRIWKKGDTEYQLIEYLNSMYPETMAKARKTHEAQ